MNQKNSVSLHQIMCAHVRMYLLIVQKEKYFYSEMDIDKNKRIGLTDEQVKQSREQHGKNVLTPPQRTSLWKLYLDKYRDPIIQILLVAAFVSLILAFIEKNFMETIGIFVAVFLATTVGFYFERDAAKKFNLLTALSEEQPVKVRRNGKVMEIPRHDVVVGDVVLVEVGDEVPADGELISSSMNPFCKGASTISSIFSFIFSTNSRRMAESTLLGTK